MNLKNGLNSFQIKIIMIILMVLDHISKIPNLVTPQLSLIFHLISRCVSVWFAYILVEGFLYTRNRFKYSLRLWSFALIMFLGNSLLTQLFKSKEIVLYNNIFLTLAFSITILNLLFNSKENKLKSLKVIFGIILVFIGVIISEGGIVVIPFVLITYIFRNKKIVRNILYLVFSLIMLFISYTTYGDIKTTIEMLLFNCDWFFISVIPFIYLYNGERGLNNKFSKYFFYIFYPLHLWIIATIAFLVK